MGAIPPFVHIETSFLGIRMRENPDYLYVYVMPVYHNALRVIVVAFTLIATVLVVAWLDTVPVQIIGAILYPIEWLMNAAFFPNAVTPLRGNGTALLVIIPTIALAGIAFAFGRMGWIVLRGGFRRLTRRRARSRP